MKAALLLVSIWVVGTAGESTGEVRCSVPVSPPNGQRFLFKSGSKVLYSCDPGYHLLGSRESYCAEDQWSSSTPTCVPIKAVIRDKELQPPLMENNDGPPSMMRPLFKWDEQEEVTSEETNDNEKDTNSTSMQSDEARFRMVLYPERRVITTRRRRVYPGSELENQENRRSQSQGIQAPSVVYVRRPLAPSKSKSQYRRVAVSAPRVEQAQNDKGGQSEEALRQMYWYANALQATHPRQAAALMDYRTGYNPYVMTLSESQLAWINSLQPELRDRYLRDLYGMYTSEAEESARAQAFLRRYEDSYRWWYNSPYYYDDQMRQPVSVVVEEPAPSYDYTCYQADRDGRTTLIRAPALQNGHVYRYDRRRNPDRSDYLAAEYRCNSGYIMLDSRHTELNCSNKRWVGVSPICVRTA